MYGEIAINFPNWHRYTTDPDDMFWIENGVPILKKMVYDLEGFFLWEFAKSPLHLGRRLPFHDNWNLSPKEKNEQFETAAFLLSDRLYHIFNASNLPPRNIRRKAWRFNSKANGIIDDHHFTTPHEVMFALKWHQEKLIESWSLSIPTKRKIAFGRFDLLKPGDVDPYVIEWRADGPAPECSRFIPPKGYEKAPVPSEFLIKREVQ